VLVYPISAREEEIKREREGGGGRERECVEATRGVNTAGTVKDGTRERMLRERSEEKEGRG